MNAISSISSITILTSLCFIIQITEISVSYESKSLQHHIQHQHQSSLFIANLNGSNAIPPVNSNATGIVKFIKDVNYLNNNSNSNYNNNNEMYYEINLTNIHNDIKKIDVHLGKKNQNGPTVVTLYQTIASLIPSEICCKSAESGYDRNKFSFNGTIFPQAFEFGPLAGSKNITDLIKIFNNGSAYVEVYTYHPDSLSLFDTDREVRGQITSK